MTANNPDLPARIALVGFGEAAQAFVAGWQREKAVLPALQAYDIKTTTAAQSAAKWQDYGRWDVAGKPSLRAALARADVVFCLVTADRAADVAAAAAAHIAPGAVYRDGNSCAPDSKRANAALISGAGARYVDMAIMAPVHPLGHKTPILLSGAAAAGAAAVLGALGMVARAEAGAVGRASSIKMVRSIMVKGLEALMAECVLAGRLAGVDAEVLASLEKSYPGFDWPRRAAYAMDRMMIHGPRRAAEMDEAVKMLHDLGLGGEMSAACADWQRRIGGLGLRPDGDDYGARADRIWQAMTAPRAAAGNEGAT